MIVFPNCKINLGLFVTEKREDGFHNLESIFIPVPCCDALEVVESNNGKIEFNVSGQIIDGISDDNICMKAYRLLQKEFNLPAVQIHLRKQIPMGSGLGGGSADGAFMLRLLNDLFNLKNTNTKLKYLASKLGSDCPFFIDNTTAFVSGRGDKLESLHVDISDMYIVLVHPKIHISTPQAYSLINPRSSGFNLKEIGTIKRQEWKTHLVNDFEAPISEAYPIISQVKQSLYDKGAIYASMSGSGSAVYGLFEKEIHFEEDFTGLYMWCGKL